MGKAVLGFFIFFSMVFCLLQSDPAFDGLKKRAEQVFSYNSRAEKKLPSHEVRALSLAIAFKDSDGASELLQKLESKIAN